MHEAQVSERLGEELVMRWVPVDDARGRTMMEAHWVVRALASAPSHITHAA